MPFNDVYRRQVSLLVRTIPDVAEENCFALKGGTAINLFYRDMPRLSVDIDLTYLPVADRQESLAEIEAALKRIGSRIKKTDKRITVNESVPGTQDTINKLVVRTPDRVQIKIEVTPVLRGCVYDPKIMSVSLPAEVWPAHSGIAALRVRPGLAGPGRGRALPPRSAPTG